MSTLFGIDIGDAQITELLGNKKHLQSCLLNAQTGAQKRGWERTQPGRQQRRDERRHEKACHNPPKLLGETARLEFFTAPTTPVTILEQQPLPTTTSIAATALPLSSSPYSEELQRPHN